MQTAHIEEIFKEYLKKEATQYALLINGTWGSGKTFFWKKTLHAIVKKQELKPLYISLNGLKTVEQLQQQLMIKLIPFFGKPENKALKNIARLTGNIGNTVIKFFKVDFSNILSGVTLDGLKFNDKVLCFDDLERCQIPIKELFGFINDFVEHKNLKCLILADAIKIDDNAQYLKIKEKVIGRELNYEPELEKVLPTLYKTYTSEDAYFTFLKQNKDYIYGIFYEYEEYNLRIISFFLESLFKIHRSLKDVATEFQEEVILFTALISIEFKRGHLKSDESNDFNGLENTSYFWYQNRGKSVPMNSFFPEDKKEPEIEPTYAEKFYLKYVESRINEFQFYGSIYTYILSGYLDIKNLKDELEKRKPEEHPKEVLEFMRLVTYNFRSIDGNEFEKLVANVLRNAENGLYSIYDYDRLSNFYHFFSQNGLVAKTSQEIDDILLKGLDLASKRKEINDRIFENLAHFAVSIPEMQPIRDKIIAVHKVIKEESEASESNILMELLENENIEDLNQLFESKKYSKDFLKYINGDQLFIVLNSVSNDTLVHFTKAMQERYKSSSLKHMFPDDFDSLNDLKLSINNLVLHDEKLDKLRIFNWKELLEILDRTCEILTSEAE